MEDLKINIWGKISFPQFLVDYDKTTDFAHVINESYHYCIAHDENLDLVAIKGFKHLNDNYDALETGLIESITISEKEMERLRKGDIVKANYFEPLNELGSELLGVLLESKIEFVMSHRYWDSSENVSVYFEVCQSLWSFNVADLLVLGFDPANREKVS